METKESYRYQDPYFDRILRDFKQIIDKVPIYWKRENRLESYLQYHHGIQIFIILLRM
jgi:hypothetical protein